MPTLQDPNGARLIPLNSISDERGVLVVVENGPDLPFSIQRCFYLVGMNTAPRGLHAHHELHELIVCLAGSCRVVIDDGSERHTYHLDRRDQGLHLSPLEWVEMDEFSPGCVLMVLASAPYDESDYLREYPDFLAALGKRVA